MGHLGLGLTSRNFIEVNGFVNKFSQYIFSLFQMEVTDLLL